MEEPIYTAMTKKELCQKFNVSIKTLTSWLKKIPGLNLTHQKVFTPKETKLILEHLT